MKKDIFREKNNGDFLETIKILGALVTVFIIIILNIQKVYAGDIVSSVIVTGTENLLKDLVRISLILAPLITIAVVAYSLVRKSMADEMDHKKCCARKYA